jgi:hypothetical protein
LRSLPTVEQAGIFHRCRLFIRYMKLRAPLPLGALALVLLASSGCGRKPRARTVEGPVVMTGPEHAPGEPPPPAVSLPAFARRTGSPCGGTLGPGASFTDFVAAALLPSWDPQKKRFVPSAPRRVDRGAGSATSMATDCFGHTQTFMNEDPGAVTVFVKKLSLPLAHPFRDGADEVALVWVYVGAELGLCPAPQGFMAVLQRRADALEVLASTAWVGSCKTEDGAASVLDVSGKPAIVDLEGDGGEARASGATGQDRMTEVEARIFGLRGHDLPLLGAVPVGLDETRPPFAFPAFRRTMRATLESHPKGLMARETWTFEPVAPVRGATARSGNRTKAVPRVYELKSGKLWTPKVRPPTP